MASPAPQLAVIGAASCGPRLERLAYETGQEIARSGCVLLCGGLGGVMAAAAEGARDAGGLTVGVLPGASPMESPPNPHIGVAVFTGMGQARNQILVLSAGAVIGIGGAWGTLSEIALAVKQGIPVVLLESWRPARPDGTPEPLLMQAGTPTEAVSLACAAARARGSSGPDANRVTQSS